VLTVIPPAPETATKESQSFLSNAGYLNPDLTDAPTSYEFLRIEGDKFIPAISLSEAHLIKINLFRKKLGSESNITSVTPNFPESNVWFIFTGLGGNEIVAGEYHHFPLDLNKSSTYPLKTADEAWEELKNKKAFIANPGNNESGRVTIRRVYIAYFDAGVYTEFYQPVVVFEGDNNFFAFVPAITNEYYGQEESQ
jgi:hypothetical protein